ncbi:LysE family transporter [Gottfriedia acidiceleris]|uniref:LysE family transporter n=1 Tax=Gottfriedia acidiceleris TaxID=371036 RepID=UPI000B439A98|nr:LysE family transporter [Gottfriedia acidiceleris]
MALLSFLLYIFVTAFTPGPNNIMALLVANKFGLKRAVRFSLGVGSGFFVLILFCAYFSLLLKNFIPKVEFIMTILGVIYMLYLAIKIISSKNDDHHTDGDKNYSYLTGMLLQFINPKGILYGITTISTFVLPYHSSNVSLLFYSFFLAFVGFLGTYAWGVFGSIFRKFLSNYHTQFNIVMAFLLMFSAISILLESR